MCSEKAPRAINWHRAGRLALYSRPRNRVLRNVTRNEPITCLTLERDSALDAIGRLLCVLGAICFWIDLLSAFQETGRWKKKKK